MIEKTLWVLEDTLEQAKESATYWTYKVNEYHVFQAPQRSVDQAANARAIAEDRVQAIAHAIAIIKAAKEYHDACAQRDSLIAGPEHQLEAALDRVDATQNTLFALLSSPAEQEAKG